MPPKNVSPRGATEQYIWGRVTVVRKGQRIVLTAYIYQRPWLVHGWPHLRGKTQRELRKMQRKGHLAGLGGIYEVGACRWKRSKSYAQRFFSQDRLDQFYRQVIVPQWKLCLLLRKGDPFKVAP